MSNLVVLDDVTNILVGDILYVAGIDGTLESATIIAITPETNTVEIDEPFASDPIPDAVWAVERPTLQNQLYRVVGIKKASPATYEFTAIKYEPGKQDYVENGIVIQPKITTALIPDLLPSPTNLRIGAYSRAGAQNASAVVVAQWDESPNAEHYEVQWRKNAGVYSPVAKVYGTVCEYDNAFPGTYEFKVAAVNKSKNSPPVFSPLVTVGNITQVPISEQLQTRSSSGGVLTIDCSLYRNFKVTLTENTTVNFINVPQSKDIWLQVTNAGSYTLSFPGSVNTTYTGPDAGASDMLLLKTINFGANWSLTVAALSAGGGYGVIIDPDYISFAGDGSSQSISATMIGGTGPFTYAWTRTDTNGGADFVFSDTTVEDPSVSTTISGTTVSNLVQTWKLTVTDSTAAVAEASVTLDAYNTNYNDPDPWCLAADSYMHDGRRAWQVKAYDQVAVWDRNIDSPGVTIAHVTNNQLGRQPVYRLTTENGYSCRVSANTPVELPDGRVVMASAMLDEQIVVCDVVTGKCWWELVAGVDYLGIGTVAKISAGDTVLLAGDGGRYMLGTHNIKWKPGDLPDA